MAISRRSRDAGYRRERAERRPPSNCSAPMLSPRCPPWPLPCGIKKLRRSGAFCSVGEGSFSKVSLLAYVSDGRLRLPLNRESAAALAGGIAVVEERGVAIGGGDPPTRVRPLDDVDPVGIFRIHPDRAHARHRGDHRSILHEGRLDHGAARRAVSVHGIVREAVEQVVAPRIDDPARDVVSEVMRLRDGGIRAVAATSAEAIRRVFIAVLRMGWSTPAGLGAHCTPLPIYDEQQAEKLAMLARASGPDFTAKVFGLCPLQAHTRVLSATFSRTSATVGQTVEVLLTFKPVNVPMVVSVAGS